MLALVAILPLLIAGASASPIQKRYTRAMIVSDRDGLCLVAAPKTGVGSAVTSENCANTQGAKYWDINPGSGSVVLSGTNLALDAGENPGNNGALKVWTSYPGLYQQTWYLTDDERIAITGGDQCLDEGDNGIQTYQCTTGNTNQIFHVRPDGGNPPPSSSASHAPSSTSSSAGPSSTPGAGQKYKIKSTQNDNWCVTEQTDGSVKISTCFDDEFSRYQEWTFTGATGGSGHIKLADSENSCLDAGNDPANGSKLKTYQCYDGLLQQTWSLNGQQLQLANGQALDVEKESGPNRFVKPFGSEKDLQTWEASTNNDPYQQFVLVPVN